MGLFDRFRKPKDTGQVSMDGAVDARSASTAGPSGAAQAAGAAGAVGAAGSATGEFRLPIADVFTIAGRGVVVVGQVAAGACRSGDAAVVVVRTVRPWWARPRSWASKRSASASMWRGRATWWG